VSKRLGSRYRSGLSNDWLKFKNPDAPAVKREAEEDWNIILLLISIDFINSEYCYDTEMERAMERHQKGEARVIPIILRSCLWQYAPFAKLQALPKDAKAVQSWSDRDEALTDIVDGIGKVAEELLEGK
jgi:hypothetical protein